MKMSRLVIAFDRKENLLIKVFRVLSVVSALFCIVMAIFSDVKYSFWILPVTYSIGMLFLGNKNVFEFTPGIVTLNIVMFCRYSVLPLVKYINFDLSVFAKQYGHVQDAIIVMWIELVAIMLTLYFTGDKYQKKSRAISRFAESDSFYDLKYGNIIAIIGFALIIVLVIRYPSLVGGLSLLTKGYLENSADVAVASGVVSIIWKAWVIWLSAYFLFLLKKKKVKGVFLVLLLVLLIAVSVLISFIGQVEISRWYSVVTFVSLYFCAVKMFPEKKKQITRLIVGPALLMLLVVSIYKNTGYLQNENATGLEVFKELFDVSTLDSYFAGPVSVNNALYLNEQSTAGFSSFIYDVFRNFPVLNHFIDVSKSSVEMYHIYLGRGDQILPLVGQSMFYFGYLGLPLFSIISVVLVRYFDYRYTKSQSLIMYMYSFMACWLGLVTILNFTICVSWFYAVIIPAFLLLKFTELAGTRKVKGQPHMEE